MKRSIAALLIALIMPCLAWAGGPERDSFEKFVSKAAPADAIKTKTPCVCFAGGRTGRAGRVYHVVNAGQVEVLCQIPFFSGDGSQSSLELCFEFRAIR